MAAFWPCINVINDSTSFLILQPCPKHLKLLGHLVPGCDHQIQAAFVAQHIGLHLETDPGEY